MRNIVPAGQSPTQTVAAVPKKSNVRATQLASLRSRDFGLDIVRAVAILLVLFTHSVLFFKESNWFTHGVLPAFGVLGVELFFGLSGFLIGMILLEGRHSLSVFYLKRFMKILPPYLLILGVVFIAHGIGTWHKFLMHVFFFGKFFPSPSGLLPRSLVVGN